MPDPNEREKDNEEEKKLPPPNAQVMEERGQDDDESEDFLPPRRISDYATLGAAFSNPQDPSYQPPPDLAEEDYDDDDEEEEEDLYEDEYTAAAPSPEVMEERLRDYDTQSSVANSSLSGSITTADDDDYSILSGSSHSGSISEDDSDAATGNFSRGDDSTLSSILSMGGMGMPRNGPLDQSRKSMASWDSSASFDSSDDGWAQIPEGHMSIRVTSMRKQKRLTREKNTVGISTDRSTHTDMCCTLCWDCCVYTAVFGCVLLFDKGLLS